MAGGTGMSAAEEMLTRLQPIVRFDAHEAFFAHDVRAMADNRSFRLTRDERHRQEPGYVIATPGSGLNLAFLTLSNGAYPNGARFEDGDHFGLDLGTPDAFEDRIGDYREMERELDGAVRNRVFGRAVTDAGSAPGSLDGDVWLQYWYFYLYNDAQFGGRVDLHEGDWEMVQILLQGGEPRSAVYAQHAYAEQRRWEDVAVDDALGCPIIYAGRGSHASYFERGLHRTHVKVGDDFLPLWWDAADGNGPEIRQQLTILDDRAPPGWALWRGRWGGTQPRLPLIDGESPGGPVTHGQWQHPQQLVEASIEHEIRPPAPAPPVAVHRSPPGLRVRFDFSRADDPPDRLLLTASTAAAPPVTETIVVGSLRRGAVVTRHALDPDRRYTIDVSTITTAGLPTAPAARPIVLGPLRALSPAPVIAWLLWQIDRLMLWVGSRLARRER